MKFFTLFILTINLYATLQTIQVFDKLTLKPIKGAIISNEADKVFSDENGKATIYKKKRNLYIKAAGYKQVDINATQNLVLLEPFTSKALYVSFWAAGSKRKMNQIINLAKKTEINTVIIDVKNEFGNISYKTNVKLAQEIGAHKQRTVYHMDRLVKRLKKANLYVIARIVVFKDNRLAKNKPEYSLKDLDTNQTWRNNEKLAWVDPFEEKVYDYVTDVAVDAASKGFDEINFDYVRFPLKKNLSYKKNRNQKNRIQAVSDFLEMANKKLMKYNVYTSADTYGYVCWNTHDTNIGHTIGSLAKHVDYIAPMLYPSGFSRGVLGYKNPTDHPYEIINISLKQALNKSNISPLRLRPWIQSFKDYAFDRKFFRSREIGAQIKGAEDAGASGWLIWNPSSRFSSRGLQDVKNKYPVLIKSKYKINDFCRRIDFPKEVSIP